MNLNRPLRAEASANPFSETLSSLFLNSLFGIANIKPRRFRDARPTQRSAHSHDDGLQKAWGDAPAQVVSVVPRINNLISKVRLGPTGPEPVRGQTMRLGF